MINGVAAARQLLQQQTAMARLITGMHFEQHPELKIRYGEAGHEKCFQDSLYHLSYLAESVRSQSAEIFTSYVEWAQTMLYARNIPAPHLIDNLEFIKRAAKQLLPAADFDIVRVYIDRGVERLKNLRQLPETCLLKSNPLLSYAEQYLSMLLAGKRREAQLLIHSLVKEKHSIADIYEYIFQATQYEVGLLWQTNKITVAHEHYCTAATQLVMASLYPYIFDTPKKGAKMVACTVSDSLHEIGIRMISDLFEMDGWDTYYLGANMPDVDIISAVKEQQADVLAISVTMPFHISKAETLIKKMRDDSDLNKLKIIIGGYPFSLVPGLWHQIGADGGAKNATEAIKLANTMISFNDAKIL